MVNFENYSNTQLILLFLNSSDLEFKSQIIEILNQRKYSHNLELSNKITNIPVKYLD